MIYCDREIYSLFASKMGSFVQSFLAKSSWATASSFLCCRFFCWLLLLQNKRPIAQQAQHETVSLLLIASTLQVSKSGHKKSRQQPMEVKQGEYNRSGYPNNFVHMKHVTCMWHRYWAQFCCSHKVGFNETWMAWVYKHSNDIFDQQQAIQAKEWRRNWLDVGVVINCGHAEAWLDKLASEPIALQGRHLHRSSWSLLELFLLFMCPTAIVPCNSCLLQCFLESWHLHIHNCYSVCEGHSHHFLLSSYCLTSNSFCRWEDYSVFIPNLGEAAFTTKATLMYLTCFTAALSECHIILQKQAISYSISLKRSGCHDHQ